MGSATTQALEATTAKLSAAGVSDLTVARELFAAAREIAESPQLSAALSAWGAPGKARAGLVTAVFAGFSPVTLDLLATAAAQRWSSVGDLVSGVEELAIRAAAVATPGGDLEGELFQVARTIATHPDLELALGSRLGDPAVKGALVEKLFAGRATDAATLVTAELVQQPRERRVRSMMNRALRIVADQRGRSVAIVRVANELDAAQRVRLAAVLRERYGKDVALNVIVDPEVVGGVRIEIGDDVIDGTVSSRITHLRQKLAG